MHPARVSAFALVLWLAAAASPAQACSPSPLLQFRLFPEGLSIPGNLVYFKVNELGREPGPASLRDRDGHAISARIRQIGPDRVFAPDEPIAAGTQVFFQFDHFGKPFTFAFKVAPPVQVELVPSKLTLASHTHTQDTTEPHESYAFSFEDGDPTDAIRHLMDERSLIDGRPAPYDGVVSTYCQHDEYQQDTCGHVQQVPRGEHELKVTTSIVGYGLTEPSTARFTTTCDATAEPTVDIRRPPPPRALGQLFALDPRRGRSCSLQQGAAVRPPWFVFLIVACLALRRRHPWVAARG